MSVSLKLMVTAEELTFLEFLGASSWAAGVFVRAGCGLAGALEGGVV